MIKIINTNTHTVAYYNELTFGKAKHFLAQCLLQQFFLEQHLLRPKKSDIDRLNKKIDRKHWTLDHFMIDFSDARQAKESYTDQG